MIIIFLYCQYALFAYAESKGVKVDEKIAELTERYKGVEGANAKGELTADLIGEYLFEDYDFVRKLSTDRGTFQKIWDEIKYLCKVATSGSYEARQLAKVERMFKKVFEESEAATKEKTQYSFSGKHSETFDKTMLNKALDMEKQGTDSEEIRQKTGWFRGYDNKWKYEIDDSKMKVSTAGLYHRNPDIRRYQELVNKVYFEETGTDAEIKELNALDNALEGVSISPKKLGDLIDHEELLSAYPDLKNIDIVFIKGANESAYHSGFREIAMPESLKLSPEKLKKTLIHEIQHAIQDIEGFASGSNPGMFNNTKTQTAYEQYQNTAGEIESRDVAERLEFNNEQRKNIRPDIDRTDVIFADNGGINFDYIGDTKDGRRCYRSGFDDSVSESERIEKFKKRISTIFNLGAVELKTDIKKIRIKGDRFTLNENLYGDKKGKSDEKTAKINSLYDLADILTTSKFDPSATKIEPSYANPQVAPKNKAHKDVKYWYKFKNEIVFDGVPYTVTFNIRDKGNDQYQYLIDFKENKTPGLSNTVVKNNLLRADQMSYSNSISPTEKNATEFSHNSQSSNTNDTESTNLSLSNSDFLSPKTKNDITGKEFKVQEDISPAVNVNEVVDVNSENLKYNFSHFTQRFPQKQKSTLKTG